MIAPTVAPYYRLSFGPRSGRLTINSASWGSPGSTVQGVTTVVSSTDLSSLRIDREAGREPGSTRKLLWILLLVIVVIAVGAAAAVMVTARRAVEVQTATVSVRGGGSGGGAGGLTANGYVVARTKASVSSKLAGRLAFLGVEEGDRVRAGDVIARLEAAEYQAFVRQSAAEALNAEATRQEAQAALTQAERAAARALALSRDSLISPQAVEDARTGVEISQARLRAATSRVESARFALAAAEANLENTLVRAPFSGTVLRKDAQVGEIVAPSVMGGGLTRGAVVTMADLSTLEVEVDVNEAYIASVRREDPADIVLDAYPTQNFPGRVRQILPTADRQKATVLVRVAIDSSDPRILPEMGARVVFRERADSTAGAQPSVSRVFVPSAAVRNEQGSDVVYLIVNERAQRRVIQAGPVMGDEREVRSGLVGGETVIIDPPADLSDAARVRVAGPDPKGE